MSADETYKTLSKTEKVIVFCLTPFIVIAVIIGFLYGAIKGLVK